jgi:hypothetical protein
MGKLPLVPTQGLRTVTGFSGDILMPFLVVAATNEDYSIHGTRGGTLELAGKEKKIRVAKKQVYPLDAHHPRSAMASPSSLL